MRRVSSETSGGRARPFKRFSNMLSSLRSVTHTPRGLVCIKNPSTSASFSVAFGWRIRLSPPTTQSFAASGPRDRRHSRFSSTVYRPHTGHFSVQCFALYLPEKGRQRLSFMLEGVASSRPSRHPNTGMSSTSQHTASSIAFPSWMGASTRDILLGSPHSLVRLHTSFWRNPPRFDGVHLIVVSSALKASVLHQELSSLLLNRAIEEVPQSDLKQGFFSRCYLVPKKDGGLRPILDLHRLNLPLYKGQFKMLTLKTIMSQIQMGDWFVTVDLKDAYFHIQIVRRHRKFLRFAIGGKAYQYKVLPLGLALAPRTFTKCMDAALAPLRLQGIRVLNYLNDWLILAHSRELVSYHRDIVVHHICGLDLRTNTKKSVFTPSRQTVFFGGSFGGSFRSNAGSSSSCPDLQFQRMFGPLQARPSCLCEHLSQAPRPYGLSLPCATSRTAPHSFGGWTIPLVDETVEDPLHRTSHSPNQGIAQLLSHPLNMARPHITPVESE